MKWTPKAWLDEQDARKLVGRHVDLFGNSVALIDPTPPDVDRRLWAFAMVACARSVVDRIEPASLRVTGNKLLHATELWATGAATSKEVDAVSRLTTNEAGFGRHFEHMGVSWAASAVERASFVATSAPSRWTANLYHVIEAAALSERDDFYGWRDTSVRRKLAELADIIRVVIPFPRKGELIAMAPHMYVVYPRVQRDDAGVVIDDSVLGLQQPPKKVRGRWWDGYIEGPVEEVLHVIPSADLMRDVYERVVVRV